MKLELELRDWINIIDAMCVAAGLSSYTDNETELSRLDTEIEILKHQVQNPED